jgi:hypothetical protein
MVRFEASLPEIGSMWFDPTTDPIRIYRVKSHWFAKWISVEMLNRQPGQRLVNALSIRTFTRKFKPYVEG